MSHTAISCAFMQILLTQINVRKWRKVSFWYIGRSCHTYANVHLNAIAHLACTDCENNFENIESKERSSSWRWKFNVFQQRRHFLIRRQFIICIECFKIIISHSYKFYDRFEINFFSAKVLCESIIYREFFHNFIRY